ncbi:MAG: MBL fold metallo-hydrolase [Acidimicrobiales bacterium]|nr:MBL fold metallo-hydrolase [Acidimicrobiales bacterium]
MRVRVWGCRGSLATPGPDTVRYGGNTSCVEVRSSTGDALVLDAGTGMRPLGLALEAEGVQRIHVLLSHLHLDHLQGLGFFAPLFDPGVEVHIWGPASPVQSLSDRIATYLSPPLFPVRLADVPSKLQFHDAPEDEVQIGSVRVRASLVTHQGPTVGYRIEEDGRSVVYLPDHEPSLGVDVADQPVEWISGHHLAHRADVLLHDAQYGDDEYPRHVGWGHSAVGHVVAFARKAEVDRLVLFHHDPGHSDEQLEDLVEEARLLWGADHQRVCCAWDGMNIELSPDHISLPAPPLPA